MIMDLSQSSSLSQSKGRFVENSDKISNLPTHIAHHILSFLMMEDIARLSMVSKWWQELCRSISSLTVDGMRYRGKDYKLIRFKNFLERLMFRRNGMKMVQFCVRWTFLKWHLDEYRFLTWLHDAVRCNVEVLYLDLCIFLPGALKIPLCVLHCESLRFLTVSLYGGVLQLPSSSGFTKLQSLSLTRVRVLDDLFVEQVLSSCNSLDKLCLDGVNGINNINIRSSSLKYLEIRSYEHDGLFHLNVFGEWLEELIIHWKFTPSGGTSLKMATPHLKCFTWGGFPPDNYFFGNLKCLRSCALSLEQLSSSWRPPYLEEFFHILEHIEELMIHAQCLKALFKAGMLPIPLKHLHTLRINLSSSDSVDGDVYKAIALLMKGVANVLGLFIDVKPSPKKRRNLRQA
ncbi:F-box/FBD/LRR-repeat protein At5g56420-like [Corylus avellana]|uniref:F-box/FBD/LRR-repeat protein At5g56420-like n=1 Tax=Corylus avellana TaxID=13451 RepID=UPI00286BD49E|nr:F-box/FBD/LRR-repeat protein At5g56420-like [Corylus avellana]XP_059427983.1 F-box/FBD/LRR-repeat protein At5g56420-like [Corylus avellana]XP_059427984.1 F-box/FBD/LRR-repeat protein At5g56420-like [Corylus avellana]